ncbi:Splicing factor-like protein [Parasponia andersonii]|uniref:Splicing factor-like protein n=1 Tax=Parasponia andersonii TaxID=3476 RepID=A0A2P5BJM7_PARAD|nr:Splicing factor-like protein [Parasponia andersonii]
MASSQHRCVFVGNIPYDATEEQLIEICQEVGPVVSFRLVIDRETGKPKGYGFCEYKDEETALSARRNLQGYEINGRQLRVDFAENDKGADRSREQGRGGPGLAPSVDPQKQVGGPAIHGDSVQHQPIGLHIAITAAAVMAGALGGAQAGMQGQLALTNDPLTFHLAKMSRSQLNEIMSEMKLMATQNKEFARQLLLARPQLPKALFQAQIMLGMVTPQVLQMPNLRQASQTPLHDSQVGQLPAVQPLSVLPPLAQSNVQSALMPKGQAQVSTVPQTSSVRNQFSVHSQLPIHPRVQPPQHANEHALQQARLPGQSSVSPFPPLQPYSSSSFSIRPQIQATSSSLNLQGQPTSLKNTGQVGISNLGHSIQMVQSNATIQPLHLPHDSVLDAGYQPGPSISSGISQPISRDADRSAQVAGDATWVLRSNTNPNLLLGLAEKRSMVSEPMDLINHPSKLMKLDDGTLRVANANLYNANGSAPSQASAPSLVANAVPKSDEVQYLGKQISQVPSEVESTLLQQVMNLTPEQLSSLPPEQQQQVVQLQQMLRREQIQSS